MVKGKTKGMYQGNMRVQRANTSAPCLVHNSWDLRRSPPTQQMGNQPTSCCELEGHQSKMGTEQDIDHKCIFAAG